MLRRGQGDLAGAAACYDEAAGAVDLQTFEFAAYLEARRAELDLLRGEPKAALSRPPMRRLAPLARWSAMSAPYLSTMDLVRQPASRIKSPSEPPLDSQPLAKVCRNIWGARLGRSPLGRLSA